MNDFNKFYNEDILWIKSDYETLLNLPNQNHCNNSQLFH